MNNNMFIKEDTELKNLTDTLVKEIRKAQEKTAEVYEALELIKDIAANPAKENKSKLKMILTGLNTTLETLSNATTVMPLFLEFKNYLFKLL